MTKIPLRLIRPRAGIFSADYSQLHKRDKKIAIKLRRHF